MDDEIKIGTFLLRLPESQLKTHLLMRVDSLKSGQTSETNVVTISRAIAVAQSQPTPMDIGAVGKEKSGKGGKGSKGAGKRNNQTARCRSHCQQAHGVQNLVSRGLHRTWPNASASCRRKRNRDSGDCH